MAKLELSNMDSPKSRKPVKIKKRLDSAASEKPNKDSEKSAKKPLKIKKSSENTLPVEKPEWLKHKKKKDLELQSDDLDSQFVEVLSAMPESMQQENDQLKEYVMMFKKLRKIARMTERQVLSSRSTRGIYPLMQVYREMREVIADMRALRDVGQLGEVLNEEVLTPMTQVCGSALIKAHQAMVSAIKTHAEPSIMPLLTNALDIAVRQAGQDIQDAYRKSLEKTIQVFNSGG